MTFMKHCAAVNKYVHVMSGIQGVVYAAVSFNTPEL